MPQSSDTLTRPLVGSCPLDQFHKHAQDQVVKLKKPLPEALAQSVAECMYGGVLHKCQTAQVQAFYTPSRTNRLNTDAYRFLCGGPEQCTSFPGNLPFRKRTLKMFSFRAGKVYRQWNNRPWGVGCFSSQRVMSGVHGGMTRVEKRLYEAG
jgi:hypothetical protein